MPSLPPLTPISKLQSIRKTPSLEHQQHQTIRFKNTTSNGSSIFSMPKNSPILKNVCFLSDEPDLNYTMQSNMKLNRQIISKEQSIAPKKNLPHKKRITKKLKSISPTDDQMHMQIQEQSAYHAHLDMLNQHDVDIIRTQSQQEHLNRLASNAHQTTSLNLTMNSQPIQLTTTRANHQSKNLTESAYSTASHFSNGSNLSHAAVQMELHSNHISESPNHLHTAQFTCEICAIQITSQFDFFKHLKFHYEPEPTNHTKIECIRSLNNDVAHSVNTPIILETNQQQSIFHVNEQRKVIETNSCITNHHEMDSSVVLENNFVRMQNNDQDYGCITGIEHEEITDDDSINDYNDSALNVIKSEQNEFSDTEDMLENGVLDKVQRVVDSFIENGTSDVKNLIDLNENQSSLVDNPCNWSTNNSNALNNGMVYAMHKTEPENEALPLNGFSIGEEKEPINSSDNQSGIDRSEDLTLIYEINMNDKDFGMMEDSTNDSQCILVTFIIKYFFN